LLIRPAIVCTLALLAVAHSSSLRAAEDFIGPEGSVTPELSLGADGSVYLSWVEGHANGHALRFAVFDDQGWSEARTVAVGDNWMVNWADWPSVTAFGSGVLLANWRQYSDVNGFAYEIRMALSEDGGHSWSEPVTLNGDQTATEHGFTSLVPGKSHLDAIWLDGRRMAAASETEQAMTLRHATVNDDGSIGHSTELDARTCDCCQTSLIPIQGGLLAGYRDRTLDDVRDIVVRDNRDGHWSAARPVHEDHWKLEGCPVNGPALAAQGSTVAAAWFTAAAGKPRVLLAVSNDGGTSFGTPLRIDEGRTLGRVALVMLDNDDVLVSWLEPHGRSSRLKLRRLKADATLGDARIVRKLKNSANQFPRMLRRGKNLVFAWVEKTGKTSRVHGAVIAADQL